MKIQLFVVGENFENTYFVIDENTNEAILVDPGNEGEKLAGYIVKNEIKLKYIVLTHAHYDHIGACEYIKNKFNVPILAGKGEELLLENCEHNLSIYLNEKIELKADKLLDDKELVSFGTTEFKVISTPGHTPGGICLYFENENVLFSGDTLFYGTIGRTDFSYGNTEQLLKSIEKLKILPDETKVFAGHGEDTTIGQEKIHNPYLSDRDIL